MKNKCCKMSPCELVTFVTAIACNMSKVCSTEELTLLAAVFTQLGDTIATILVQEEALETAQSSTEEDDCSGEDSSEKKSSAEDSSGKNSSGKDSSGKDSSGKDSSHPKGTSS